MKQAQNSNEVEVSRLGSRGKEFFLVDTSDEACVRFGFKSRDRVRMILTDMECEVVGVAPHESPCTQGDALWVRIKGRDNVCFIPDPQENLELIK